MVAHVRCDVAIRRAKDEGLSAQALTIVDPCLALGTIGGDLQSIAEVDWIAVLTAVLVLVTAYYAGKPDRRLRRCEPREELRFNPG